MQISNQKKSFLLYCEIEDMVSIGEVGEILDSRMKAYVEWKVPNYFSLPQKADVYSQSPSFYFLNENCYIRMYPNGRRATDTVGCIDLYLIMNRPVSSYSVTFKLGLKFSPNVEFCISSKLCTFDSAEGYGYKRICERNGLLQLLRYFSSVGTLIVYCDAIADFSTNVTDAASQTVPDSTALLCRDFQDLLQSKRNSDVTIEVCGHVFHAHKLILESRSPVFSAMFDHNMQEKSDRVVKISDCNPDAFQDFLQYVYTGKLEKCSWDNVFHLFTIADKYCMTGLKEQCTEYMAKELLVDNVCDVFVVADRHNETKLKDRAEKFVIENIATIKTTDKWKSFVAQNSLLAVEILMKCCA